MDSASRRLKVPDLIALIALDQRAYAAPSSGYMFGRGVYFADVKLF